MTFKAMPDGPIFTTVYIYANWVKYMVIRNKNFLSMIMVQGNTVGLGS